MGKKKKDQYEKIIQGKPPEVAVQMLYLLCLMKDERISELKAEIQAKKEKNDG